MTIETAVQVLGGLGLLATTFLGLFVGSRISASERRMLKEIADTYLPREVADEKFRYYDYRFGESPTPKAFRRSPTADEV